MEGREEGRRAPPPQRLVYVCACVRLSVTLRIPHTDPASRPATLTFLPLCSLVFAQQPLGARRALLSVGRRGHAVVDRRHVGELALQPVEESRAFGTHLGLQLHRRRALHLLAELALLQSGVGGTVEVAVGVAAVEVGVAKAARHLLLGAQLLGKHVEL